MIRPLADMYLNSDGEWRLASRLTDLELCEGALSLASLPAGGLYATGHFIAGPIFLPQTSTGVRRVRVHATLPPNESGRLQLHTWSSANAKATPPTWDADSPNGWHAAPLDATEFLVFTPADTSHWLWVAGVFTGDGRSTPRLHQVRVETDPAGWIDQLPALYRRDADQSRALAQVLALFQGGLGPLEELIADLPRLFDPSAAPDRPAPWLDWLAGWVDSPLRETWSAATRREAIATAVQRHAHRGTAAGVRAAVQREVGVTVRITELATAIQPWLLGEGALGLETQLAAAQPDAAILGTTAVLGEADLDGGLGWGASLFTDTAHRFQVEVYEADLRDPNALRQIEEVIEREKPAHTLWTLCVIRAALRVGVQARLGVDAIVAGPPAPWRLDTAPALDGPVVLGASPAGRLGRAAVGQARVVQ